MSEEGRPLSRRGNDHRMSVMAENPAARPSTAAKVATAMRPPSVMSQMRVPSTTANRLNTGLTMPPKTGQMINIADRPITQQGLSGLRTGTAQGNRRQVLDKRYYEGLLRQKMKNISNEVRRLQGVIEDQRQHEATADVYNAKVKEVAQELTELQGDLLDYNQVMDRVHTGSDASEAILELEHAISDNNRDGARVNQLYHQNQELKEELNNIESQIINEKNLKSKLLLEMDEGSRTQYEAISNKNEGLLADIAAKQHILEGLKATIAVLQEQVSTSQIRQEAVLLHQKLRERQEKKEQLVEEELRKGTPAQEREQLLQKVRDDNAEMAAMERQMAQLTQNINSMRQEMEMAEQDLEESTSDRHQKLKELRQREETMEKFLVNFDEARKAEIDRIQILEGKVELSLQQMTRNLSTSDILPSNADFESMRATLTVKQDELEKSKFTAEEVALKEASLRENVAKINELEDKIKQEMSVLQDEINQMLSDMPVLSDLETLRKSSSSKRDELLRKRDELISKQKPLEKIKELKMKHEELTKKLNDDDTYVQINTLQKKFHLLEDANKTQSTQLASKKSELNYEDGRAEALQLLNQYNQMLQKRHANK